MTLDEAATKIGNEAIWDYVPRGGYGWSYPVRVTILSVGRVKVRVRAPVARGGEKNVLVLPEKLRNVPEIRYGC